MKRALIVVAYSIVVTVLLLLAGYWGTKPPTPVVKTDYSALWEITRAKDATAPRPAKEYNEVKFKDKSMAKGVDAKPSLSVG